ncbi:glycosyltransferase family 9 protein [Candidatus Thioglobus sp.]|nr:glycosyltransferase family 9 protein [Candidatus Thioglobus sp.]
MFVAKKIKAYLLRFFTRKKEINFDIKDVKKVLFFRYDRIGDMVITTPVFRELKLFFPDIRISVLASKANQSVLSENPYIEKVYVNHKNRLLSDLRTLFILRKKNFDACIEFDHSVIPHAILRLKIVNPKIVISVSKQGRYGVKGSELMLYDFYTEKKNGLHFRDIWLETLSPFGIKPKSNHYDLFSTNAQKKVAYNFISKYHDKFLIGINLEGAVKGKKIDYEDLEKICRSLFEVHNNIKIIVLSAPNNFQRVQKIIIKMGLNYVINSYKTNTIMDIVALINQMDLIITPDTSISHIASAFNKPVVTIHENNQDSYQLFAPTSNLNRTVFSKSRNSLNGFSLDELIAHCLELIKLKKQVDYEQ